MVSRSLRNIVVTTGDVYVQGRGEMLGYSTGKQEHGVAQAGCVAPCHDELWNQKELRTNTGCTMRKGKGWDSQHQGAQSHSLRAPRIDTTRSLEQEDTGVIGKAAVLQH
jgi:hypothetical protein